MSDRIADDIKEQIKRQAGYRCGYCCSRQEYVLGFLEIDHIIPKAQGGTDNMDNLWLACRLCNNYKGIQTHGHDPLTNKRVRLFNPRKQRWVRHFQWSNDGLHIIGRTSCGRATVVALNLNNLIAVMVRRKWIEAGWHPPEN